MGFKKDWDANAIRHSIWKMAHEAGSPYNDGWTASACKKELYELKCLVEDLYNQLPTFVGEDEWEQERIIQILKKP
jgi:hypothetical protein